MNSLYSHLSRVHGVKQDDIQGDGSTVYNIKDLNIKECQVKLQKEVQLKLRDNCENKSNESISMVQNTETIHPNPIYDIRLKDFINKTMEALNDSISSLKVAADVKDVTRILNEILNILMVFKKDFITTHENNFKSIKNGIDIVNKKGSNSESEQISTQNTHKDFFESHLNGEEILTNLQIPIKINFQKDCSDEERTDFEDKEHAVVDEYIDNLKDEYSMENEEEVVNDEDYNNDEDDESNEAPVAINCQKRRKYAQDVCSICKMKSWDIVTHEKETHMKDGAFICIYCDFKSLKKNELVG